MTFFTLMTILTDDEPLSRVLIENEAFNREKNGTAI